MAASAAATAKFINTNTCPASLPHSRLNAANTMFDAASISSMHIITTRALRRTITPTIPTRNSAIASTR